MSYNDTSPEAEAILNELSRQAPVWRKFRALGQLNAMAKALALSDLRDKHPRGTEAELQRLLADRILGKELAALIYGAYPLTEPGREPADVV